MEHLFQPPERGGLGFKRVSDTIQRRKQTLVDRLLGSPPQLRPAIRELMSRAELGSRGGLLTQGVELWGSSLLEYAAEGRHHGAIPSARMEESLLENQIGDAVGDLTPTMRADLDAAGITSIADLTYMEGDRRRWRTFSSAWPYITAYTQVSAPPQGPRRLKVGQVWQCVTRKGSQWLGADRLKEIVAILPGGDLQY